MRKLLSAMGLLLGLALLAPPDVAGQKEQKATWADYKVLENYNQIEGVLKELEPSTRRMTLKAGYFYLVPNPHFRPDAHATNAYASHNIRRLASNYRYWVGQYNAALRTVNPVLRIRRLQVVAVNMNAIQLQYLDLYSKVLVLTELGPPPFLAKVAYKDIKAQATEDVVARRSNLPTEYDDKGNVKEFTVKEKKELRGTNPKVPGYKAAWEDVQVGQTVMLYPKLMKSSKKADPNEEADDAESDPRVRVSMILIEADRNDAAVPAVARKKQ
jgi:hypothetical protein